MLENIFFILLEVVELEVSQSVVNFIAWRVIQCDLALSPVFTSQEEIFEPGYAIPMNMHMIV